MPLPRSAVRKAIDEADAAELARALAADESQANALVRWGRNDELLVHPLHYLCDKVFDGTITNDDAVALARVLLDAGAERDFQSGDPLNAAARLGATDVGLLLLDAGARPELRGGLGETALHWAAYCGAEVLVARLIEAGAPLETRDHRWNATPLRWALQGWSEAPVAAERGSQREVVLQLVRAGAAVEPEWLSMEKVAGDAEVASALRTLSAPSS